MTTIDYQLKLYKYKSIADLSHIIHFLNNKIWLPPAGQFNDPFEGKFKLCSPDPDIILKNEKIYKFYFEYWKKNEYPELTDIEFVRMLKDIKNHDIFDKSKYNIINNSFQENGVFCLASSYKNIPMWSHYGNNHKGYCVIYELDFEKILELSPITKDQLQQYIKNFHENNAIISFSSKLEPELSFAITRVYYQNELPTIDLETMVNLVDYEKIRYVIANSLGVKFKEWEYEDEYRIITNVITTVK